MYIGVLELQSTWTLKVFWLLEEESVVVIPNEATGGANQKEVAVDIGNLKLRMYQGDITLADVDVIVNSTDITMNLSTGNICWMKTFLWCHLLYIPKCKTRVF